MKDAETISQLRCRGGRFARMLALCGMAAFVVTSDAAGQAGATSDLEVLVGHFYCGYDDDDGIVYITFEATGDVNLQSPSLYNNGASFEEDPAGTCNLLRESVASVAGESRCGVSAVQETQHTDGGESQQFDFVCTAGRDRIIRTLGAIIGQYYGIQR